MNEYILPYLLASLILIYPFLCNQFLGILDVLEKTTVDSPVTYVNTSLIKILIKEIIFKKQKTKSIYIVFFMLLFLSLILSCLVWFNVLGLIEVDISYFLLIIVSQVTLLLLCLINESKRLNVTDLQIEYSSFNILLILGFSIVYQSNKIDNLPYSLVSCILLSSLIYLYALRIEKILAISEYFKKYLLEIFRITILMVFTFQIIQKIDLKNVEIIFIILIIIPLFYSVFLKTIYDKLVNTKNNSINKFLERWFVVTMNIFLIIGVIIA